MPDTAKPEADSEPEAHQEAIVIEDLNLMMVTIYFVLTTPRRNGWAKQLQPVAWALFTVLVALAELTFLNTLLPSQSSATCALQMMRRASRRSFIKH